MTSYSDHELSLGEKTVHYKFLPSQPMTFLITNTNDSEGIVSPVAGNTEKPRKVSRSGAQARQRRTAATQRARREVLANTREDWTWPPASDQPLWRFPRRINSTTWRARESDSTPLSSRSPSPSSQDPYRFESPDAVAPLVVSQRSKRRKLLKEELEWNKGLKIFVERRDYWTGAESHGWAKSEDLSEDPVVGPPSTTRETGQEDLTCRNIPESTPIGASDSEKSIPISNAALDASVSILSSTPPSTRTSQSAEICSPHSTVPYQPSSNIHDPPPVLVPLAPPLLSPAGHPDVAEINPAIYPTIYSKCVVQGLAPSYPINLKHMIGSLVRGWKEDGEWPPKSIVPEKGLTLPKTDSLKDKMRGLRVDGDDVRLEKVARKGVGKVKRALGR